MSLTSIRHILCASDFPNFSTRALEHAVALARWSGARLTVMHSVPPPEFLVPTSRLDDATRERLRTKLERFSEPAASAGLGCDLAVREGEPAREIVAEAATRDVDLIVVGTHGRRGLDHWETGSVAEKVIRTAPCPVLTVPRGSRPLLGRDEPPFRSVLCALDLDQSSAVTLEYGLSVALRAKAAVAVLYAMEDVRENPSRLQLRLGVPFFAAYRDASEADARAHLRQLLSEEVRAACQVKEIIVAGKARRQIVRIARQRGADLVVICVHGAKPFKMMLFGSTASRVVRQASCPVLTVPSRARAGVPDAFAGRLTLAQPFG